MQQDEAYGLSLVNINDLDKSLIDEKSDENVYVAYKTPCGVKPLHIIFANVNGYIRQYDKTRYLSLFHSNEKYKRKFDRIRYLMFKSNISDIYSHKYMKIKSNSDNDLPLEKNTKHG